MGCHKKKLYAMALCLTLPLHLAACGGNTAPQQADSATGQPKEASTVQPQSVQEEGTVANVAIIAGGQEFTATLYTTQAAQAFAQLLPLSIEIEELNGNEKYCYLPHSLPTDEEAPGTIHSGDLMLYGTNCLVLFYDTFRTPYRYTALGRIEDTGGLTAALGDGSATITIEVR